MTGVVKAVKNLNAPYCTPTSIRKYIQRKDKRFRDLPCRQLEGRIKFLARKGMSLKKLQKENKGFTLFSIRGSKNSGKPHRKSRAAGPCRRHIPKRPYCSFYKKRCCRVKRVSCRKNSCGKKGSKRSRSMSRPKRSGSKKRSCGGSKKPRSKSRPKRSASKSRGSCGSKRSRSKSRPQRSSSNSTCGGKQKRKAKAKPEPSPCGQSENQRKKKAKKSPPPESESSECGC